MGRKFSSGRKVTKRSGLRREVRIPGIFFEVGLNYVLCRRAPRTTTVKALKRLVKEIAPDIKLIRQGKSKLFYMEGPSKQVYRVHATFLLRRLEYLRKHVKHDHVKYLGKWRWFVRV